MKKTLLFIIVVIFIFAMPFAAVARMSSITDADLDDVMGKTGVVIDLTFHVTDSYIAWADPDGYALAGLGNQGVLSLTSFTIDADGQGGDLSLEGLSFDIGSTTSPESYFAIGLPNMDGYITCNSIKIGSVENAGGGLGHVVIGDLKTQNSTVKLSTH